MDNVLIGAGGHASVVWEIAQQNGVIFDAFFDDKVDCFKNLKKANEEDVDACKVFFLGVGGVTPQKLEKRHNLYTQSCGKGLVSVKLQSIRSYVSPSAHIEPGTFIAHGAIIQPGAVIHSNCIINTGAIIEHDAVIESGCHIAPGAIVLGGAKVGQCSMIGAGAVVLPYQEVSPYALVSSLKRYQA